MLNSHLSKFRTFFSLYHHVTLLVVAGFFQKQIVASLLVIISKPSNLLKKLDSFLFLTKKFADLELLHFSEIRLICSKNE